MSMVPAGTTELAVYERGGPGPGVETFVLVHGFPDSHTMWDPVADRLAARGFHVVSFDVRGVGRSRPALEQRPYRLERMADDIDAVVRAVRGDRPAHLVGHDWGGVEGWEYVTSDACEGQVASFTTISGPNLDHFAQLLRRDRRAALDQLPRSFYTVVLSVPGVRTAMWRLGAARVLRRWLRVAEGLDPAEGYPGPGLARDAMASVPLYRTNVFGRLRRPRPRSPRVPVHQLVPTGDRYISAAVVVRSSAWVDGLTHSEIDAGHWAPRTHPDEVAAAIADHVTRVAASAPPAAGG